MGEKKELKERTRWKSMTTMRNRSKMGGRRRRGRIV